MEYTIISGDSHVDLTWLPGDLFASNAPADMAAKMPKVVEDERGKSWRANGIELGGVGGLGFTGEKVEKGWSKRLDRMISLGFYEDGAKGLFHPTTPELRAKDQDLDGVEAEVIYGILGVGLNLKDPEAMSLVYRIYNDWAADFCKSNPERFRALACIPNHDPAEAASELRRASGLGLRGADFAVASASKPMYHEDWDVLWEAAEETQAPISFHTVGFTPRQPDPEEAEEYERRYKAVRITMFQLSGVEYLASVIFSGACDRHPGLRFVLGESGVSWLPYVLDRMDHEYDGPLLSPELIDDTPRVLAQAGLLHLSEGDHRSGHGASYGRRQHYLGLRLPAPGWRLARLPGHHCGESGGCSCRGTGKDHSHECGQALRVY